MNRFVLALASLFVLGGVVAGAAGLRALAAVPRREPELAGQAAPRSTASTAPAVARRTTPGTPAPAADEPATPTPGSATWGLLYAIDGDFWATDGATAHQLTRAGDLSGPTLADGLLAFARRQKNSSDIWLAQAGAPPRQVTRDASSVVELNHWAMQPALIPGEARAYVLGDFSKAATGPGDLAVWEVDLRTGAPVQISHPPSYTGGDQDVSVDPRDPRQIVFTRYTYDPNLKLLEQIFALSVRQPSAVPLTSPQVSARQGAFSPDGTRLAFVQRDGTNEDLNVGQILTVGGEPRLANVERVATGVIAHPAWRPDGGALAYVAQTGQQFQISSVAVSARADGSQQFGKPHQVTGGASVDATSAPVWLTAQQLQDVPSWLAPLNGS